MKIRGMRLALVLLLGMGVISAGSIFIYDSAVRAKANAEALRSPELQQILDDRNVLQQTKDVIRMRPLDVLESLRAYGVIPGERPDPGKPPPLRWDEMFPPDPETKKLLDGLNNTIHNVYGKVVDQAGRAVRDVEVKGSVERILALSYEPKVDLQEHRTSTDANGHFHFAGLRGSKFSLGLKRRGYILGLNGEGSPSFNDMERSSPDRRALFVMWKSRGAEPLVYASSSNRVPYQGGPLTFDLYTGEVGEAGELHIHVTSNPTTTYDNVYFDWKADIIVVGGGIMEASGPYFWEAPENGYQPRVVVERMKADSNEEFQFAKKFYIRTRGGSYGRVDMYISADHERRNAMVRIEVWLNPSSRNLEYDPKMAIKAPFRKDIPGHENIEDWMLRSP